MKLGVMIEAQEGVGWPEWKNITQWTRSWASSRCGAPTTSSPSGRTRKA